MLWNFHTIRINLNNFGILLTRYYVIQRSLQARPGPGRGGTTAQGPSSGTQYASCTYTLSIQAARQLISHSYIAASAGHRTHETMASFVSTRSRGRTRAELLSPRSPESKRQLVMRYRIATVQMLAIDYV